MISLLHLASPTWYGWLCACIFGFWKVVALLTADYNLMTIVDSRHRGTMNLPQSDEMAILLSGDGSEAHDDFDVIIQSHRGKLQRIHMLNGSFEPLHFPLLFPYGELGFMNGMPQRQSLRKRPQLTPASEHDQP